MSERHGPGPEIQNSGTPPPSLPNTPADLNAVFPSLLKSTVFQDVSFAPQMLQFFFTQKSGECKVRGLQ